MNLYRKSLLALLLLSITAAAGAQYYYRDIIGARESAELIRNMKKAKVSTVKLASFNERNVPIEDFYVEQQFFAQKGLLVTSSSSGATEASQLFSYTDAAGHIIRTVDSTENTVSVTTYTYNADGSLAATISNTGDSSALEQEVHLWQYTAGKPYRMLRIKNRKDTTFVNFVLDDKGLVSEEREVHKGITSEPVYYYYNDKGQLTDIVRYNKRAARLLPEYMFEYSDKGQVIQKITVPANNSDYTIWRYQYNGWGLKTKEAVYNKQKKLTGKVEYQYTFSEEK